MTKVKSICLFLLLFIATTSILLAQKQESPVFKEDSSAFFNPSLQEKEKNAEDLMKEAIAHFDGGRYSKSVSKLDKAIEINEFNQLKDILYFYRAVSKTKMNNYSAAIEDYNAAIKANPYKSKYIYHRALAYFQTANYKNAEIDFQKSLTIDGENADIYLKLGFLKQQQNDLRGAIKDYSKAIKLNPNLADSYYYRGVIYLQVLSRDKACIDLKTAADLGHQAASKKYDKYCGS